MIPEPGADTIWIQENITELPEVTVTDQRHKILHILAYIREYSTLSSYTDTVTLFREKMVDFMFPENDRTGFRGWRYPRVLNAKSYYQFTNAQGLDSVSDRCNHHSHGRTGWEFFLRHGFHHALNNDKPD